jgi:hypothetical protein
MFSAMIDKTDPRSSTSRAEMSNLSTIEADDLQITFLSGISSTFSICNVDNFISNIASRFSIHLSLVLSLILRYPRGLLLPSPSPSL